MVNEKVREQDHGLIDAQNHQIEYNELCDLLLPYMYIEGIEGKLREDAPKGYDKKLERIHELNDIIAYEKAIGY